MMVASVSWAEVRRATHVIIFSPVVPRLVQRNPWKRYSEQTCTERKDGRKQQVESVSFPADEAAPDEWQGDDESLVFTADV